MKTRTTGPPGQDSLDAFRFAPEVGRWRTHLVRLVRLAKQGREELQAYLDTEATAVLSEASDPDAAISPDRLRWGCALSILHDLLAAGGSVHAIDSELYASWPDWSGPGGRELARHALGGVEPVRPLSTAERRRVEPMVAADMATDDLRRFMLEARFWLEPVSASHSSGYDYSTAFGVALRSWTMPYRGRSGRSRRFVVLGEAPVLPTPVVIGLIEIGDEAPYSTERDQLLVLRPAAFHEWFVALTDREAVARELSSTFRRLREAVLPVESFRIPGDLDEVLAGEAAIQLRAGGRSQSHVGHREKKRLAYVLRLAHGERVFQEAAAGTVPSPRDPSLREGLRAIHDLTVPRVHMEATICGALPPFSRALAGKLVVAFLAHPDIVGSTKGPPGEIVTSLFDVNRIDGLLPDTGMLALTTKGLYPGHSALYNRASVPGADGMAVTLRKLGDTRGESTMLVRDRTARLAQRVVEGARSTGRVALVYGTGGSKRMRFLESAAFECGLPKRIVHAGMRRPVYGMRLVTNMADVIWRRAQPRWLVDTEGSAEDYSRRATHLWRSRWGDRSSSASTSQDSPVAGLLSLLGSDG
jgi:hypothetical protein